MEPVTEIALQKLHAARLKIGEIEVLMRDYVNSQTDPTVLREASEHEVFHVTQLPSAKISILAGEVFYQVRSALDHIFYELVRRNHTGVPLPANWERQSQFPLITANPVGSTSPVPRDAFPCALKAHLTDAAFEFVERLQPYNRFKDTAAEELYLLAKFSNIDKHRRINTTSPRATQVESATVSGGTITTFGLMVKPGQEIRPLSQPPEMPREFVHVKRELELFVAFDEPEVMQPYESVPSVLYPIENVGKWITHWFERDYLKGT